MRQELLRLHTYGTVGSHYHNFVIFDSELIGVAYEDGYMRKEFIFAITDACSKSLERVEYYIIENRLNIIENTYPWEHIFVYSTIPSDFLYQPFKLKKQYLDLCETYGVEPLVSTLMEDLSNLEYLQHEILKAIRVQAKIIIIKDLADLIKDEEKQEFQKMITMCKRLGMTFISYDKFKKEDVAILDRLIVMRDGEIIQVLQRPTEIEEKLTELNQYRQEVIGEYASKDTVLCVNNYTASTTGLSFDLHRGECIWLKVDNFQQAYQFIDDVMKHDRKDIVYFGEDKDRETLFVDIDPVENSFFPDFTIEENISMVMNRKQGVHWHKKSFEKNIRYELKGSIPEDWFELYSDQLTKSELLEVYYAKVMFFHPKLLLMLHPFYHLNYSESDIVLRWIKKYRASGCAVILLSPIEPHLSQYNRKYSL